MDDVDVQNEGSFKSEYLKEFDKNIENVVKEMKDTGNKSV